MKYESYDAVRIADDLSSFDFISTGKYGSVLKRIVFEPMGIAGIYVLAFGNVMSNDAIDDYSITDNGDRNKILATVVDAVNSYTERYPDRMIYFLGSTNHRTRLYRMAIGLNLEELSHSYDIYAGIGDEFIPFYRNINATAFLIKRKSFNYPFTTI
jgi:hypothetical protein